MLLQALLVSGDLMLGSQFQAAAARQQVQVATALGAEAALKRLADEPAALVVLDLAAPGVEPAQLVPRLQALTVPPRQIVAFGPHVHEARLAAAQDAGCDHVLSRGQFVRQLDALLASR